MCRRMCVQRCSRRRLNHTLWGPTYHTTQHGWRRSSRWQTCKRQLITIDQSADDQWSIRSSCAITMRVFAPAAVRTWHSSVSMMTSRMKKDKYVWTRCKVHESEWRRSEVSRCCWSILLFASFWNYINTKHIKFNGSLVPSSFFPARISALFPLHPQPTRQRGGPIIPTKSHRESPRAHLTETMCTFRPQQQHGPDNWTTKWFLSDCGESKRFLTSEQRKVEVLQSKQTHISSFTFH